MLSFGTGFIQSLLALEVGTQCVLFVDASLSVERIVRVSLKKLSFVCRGWYLVQDENPYRSNPTALFQRNNLARNVLSLDLGEDQNQVAAFSEVGTLSKWRAEEE